MNDREALEERVAEALHAHLQRGATYEEMARAALAVIEEVRGEVLAAVELPGRGAVGPDGAVPENAVALGEAHSTEGHGVHRVVGEPQSVAEAREAVLFDMSTADAMLSQDRAKSVDALIAAVRADAGDSQ